MDIRNELEELHRDDLDAFVQDEFSHVYNDFSQLMTNTNKINLLLAKAGVDEPIIAARLVAWRYSRPGPRMRARVVVLLLTVQGSVPAEATAESHAVREALIRSRSGRTLDVQECRVETAAEIRAVVGRLKPQAIHVAMPGDGRASTDGTSAGTASAASSMSHERSLVQALAGAGADPEKPLRLLTLSGYRSDEYANHLAGAVACTVGMQGLTSAKAATVFYGAFYKDIGDGRSVATAFRRARTELGIHDPAQDDRPIWFTSNGAPANEALFPTKWMPSIPRGTIVVGFVTYLFVLYLVTSWLLVQYG